MSSMNLSSIFRSFAEKKFYIVSLILSVRGMNKVRLSNSVRLLCSLVFIIPYKEHNRNDKGMKSKSRMKCSLYLIKSIIETVYEVLTELWHVFIIPYKEHNINKIEKIKDNTL